MNTRMSDGQTLFRTLPGMPVTGPYAEQFTVPGHGTHREGLVVEVTLSDGRSWVGNFQKGRTGFSEVLLHANGVDLVVVAGGQGYWVGTEERKALVTFGEAIDAVDRIPNSGWILFLNGLEIICFGPSGVAWQTSRYLWNGFRGLTVRGALIGGEAWDLDNERWEPFELKLATGERMR